MQNGTKCCSFSLLIGRLCISAIFILAGVGKFLDFEGTSQYMASKGMTMIPYFLVGAALVEFFGGLSIFLGYRTRFGASLLLLFLIPTTYIFHDFWNLQGMEQHMMFIEFMKNLSIFGGLFYVLGAGPGKFSLDGSCSESKCCPPQPPK